MKFQTKEIMRKKAGRKAAKTLKKENRLRQVLFVLIFSCLALIPVIHIGWTIPAEIELEGLETGLSTLKAQTTLTEAYNAVQETFIEPSIQEYVFNEVQRELGFQEAVKAVSMIGGCENRAWDVDIVVREPNGTLSFGLWQINSVHEDISNADKLDYRKATEWSINKRIKDGSWAAWSCG